MAENYQSDQVIGTQQKKPDFAHPIEEQFARILDFYGITWLYEPKTFILQEDIEGRILEAFTPDFYLPDQDLFVELTTLRPQLNNIKNRKIRRLKVLYPEVNIKLFKRQDLRALMVKYGLDNEAGYLRGSDAQKNE